MRRIAVDVDGSPGANSALQWATSVAAATGAELVAIHALRGASQGRSPDEHARLVGMRRACLTGEWTASAATAGVTCHAVLEEGDPRDVVLPAASSQRADLLVLGRTGAGGAPGFLHLGSLVEYAVHHAALPLAVVPTGWEPTVKRIAVGVDGSAASKRALSWASDLATAFGAALVLVGVHEPIVEWTPAPSGENWRRQVEAELAELARPAVDAGLDVTTVGERDIHPADGLLGVASLQQADALVIGTRGLGGFSGLRAGGVTLKVLHRAALPLVVVPVT